MQLQKILFRFILLFNTTNLRIMNIRNDKINNYFKIFLT
jgi:hypothetical protein